MAGTITLDIVEAIDYKPKFDRTVIKGSSGAIVVPANATEDAPEAIQHILQSPLESVWFWQQGAGDSGQLCANDQFTHNMVNGHEIHYITPIFRCHTGDTYDIYWEQGMMATVKVEQGGGSMDYARFYRGVVLPIMYRLLKFGY